MKTLRHLLGFLSIVLSICPATTQAASSVEPALLQALIEQLRADVADARECAPGKGTVSDATEIPLADGEPPASLLTSANDCLCGQVNCAQWIYRRNGKRLELLLETQGYRVTTKPPRTHGYLAVSVASRNDAATIDHLVYTFDGRVYRPSEGTTENVETHRTRPTLRRIRFARGASSAVVDGEVGRGSGDSRLLGAGKGQTLSLAFDATTDVNVRFSVIGPQETGNRLIVDRARRWTGVLPVDGDYTIVVDAGGDRSTGYRLDLGVR